MYGVHAGGNDTEWFTGCVHICAAFGGGGNGGAKPMAFFVPSAAAAAAQAASQQPQQLDHAQVPPDGAPG